MEKIEYKQFKETVYFEKLANGLRVYLLPKPEFNKTYATFTTAYGAIDSQFVPRDDNNLITVPHGIAHFLEHKMFEQVDGDVFLEFSKQGASANAYTSLDETCYLFSATTNVLKNVTTLLDFVQDPYFTDENVEKEKGIIEQEIKMYDDNPSSVSYHNMMKLLYPSHPAGIDVAGSVESVYAITKDDLYTCYNTFYHPSNMIMVIAGNFEVDKMIETIRENQENKQFSPVHTIKHTRTYDSEPVKSTTKTVAMDVSMPKVKTAIKLVDEIKDPLERIRKDFAMQLLCELAFGKTSNAYQQMMKNELINSSFGTLVNYTSSYGYILFATDTYHVDDFIEALRKVFVDRSYIQLDDLNQIKKRIVGEFLIALNSLEFIANDYAEYAFEFISLFDIPKIIEDINIKEIIDVHKTIFQNPELVTTIIEPK